jgi:hypothetical protein
MPSRTPTAWSSQPRHTSNSPATRTLGEQKQARLATYPVVVGLFPVLPRSRIRELSRPRIWKNSEVIFVPLSLD